MIKEYTFYATGNEEVHVEWQHKGVTKVRQIHPCKLPKDFNLNDGVKTLIEKAKELYGENRDFCLIQCFWDDNRFNAMILTCKEIKRVYPNKVLTK